MKHLKLFFALFAMLALGVGNAWAQTVTWEEATSIAAGDVVALVCDSKKMELSGISTTSTKYGLGVAYTSTPAGAYVLTVEAGSTSGTYSFKCTNGQYLYWTSGNSLATNATKNANTSWKVTFSNGDATILNEQDNSRKLGWNASNPRFACYTSNQTAVQLYKKVESTGGEDPENPGEGGGEDPVDPTPGTGESGTIVIKYNSTFAPALPTASGSVNTTATAHTAEGLSFKEIGIYKGSSSNYLMFTQNKGFLYNTQSLGTITSVSVTYTSGTSTSGQAGVYFGTTELSTYTNTSNSTIKGQSQTDTWTNTTEGNGFFQLSTSNKNVQITQIEITYTSGGSTETAPSLTTDQFSWSATTATATLPNTFDNPPTLTNTESLAVSYSSSKGEVATIDENGNVTLVGKGETVISATAGDDETYKKTTVSYTLTVKPAPLAPIAGGVIDILNQAWTGKTNSTYGDVAAKTAENEGHSNAQYVAQCAGDKSSIQLRSNNNNSGVVSTISGGIVKRVEVEWQNETTAGRILQVYGSNTAYEAATDLYSDETKGTLLGEIKMGGDETVVDYSQWTGDYKYIGLRSKSGAMYLTTITITWLPINSKVTIDDAIQNGSISVSGAADLNAVAAGTMLTLDNTSDAGYKFVKYNVYKTGEPTTEIDVENSKFTMPEYDVTVSATFTSIKELDKIEVNTTNVKKTFWQGEAFNSNGLEVTAYYTDGTSAEVTPTNITGGNTENAGEITVTVSYTEGSNTKTTTYNIIVKAIENNETTVYTVAQAREIIDAVGNTTVEVYVRGIVSKIVTAFNPTYGNISYDISADGSKTSDQLQAYRGFSYNGDWFTSVDDIQVGDVVVVKGKLKIYNTTYELDEGNQLVKLERSDEPKPTAASLPFYFDGNKDDIADVVGMSQTGLGSYSSSPKLKFDDENDNVIIHFDSEPGEFSFALKQNGSNAGTFTVYESANGEDYTSVWSGGNLGNGQTSTIESNLSSTARYVKFELTTRGSSTNYGLGQISIKKIDKRQDAGLAWNPATISLTVGETFTAPTLSNPNGLTGITFTSDNEALATVNNAGVISLVSGKTGTATITATFADGDATYKPAEVTCVITVSPKSEKVVILAEYNGQWYALKAAYFSTYTNRLAAIPVNYVGGKLYNVAEADKATIEWQLAMNGAKATFKNGDNYLTGTDGTDLTLSTTAFEWDYDGELYLSDGGTRTFIYHKDGYFRNYATSNAIPNSTTYSDKPVVTAPVYDTAIEIGSGDNSTVIAANQGQIVKVIVDRAFEAGDEWYTLCVPFNMQASLIGTAYQLSGLVQKGTDYVEVNLAAKNTIEAGKPYLVKPNVTVNKFVVENVTIVNTTGESIAKSIEGLSVEMQGVINGSGTTGGLYWVGNSGYLYNDDVAKLGLRTYFNITTLSGIAPRMRVVAGENVETGVEDLFTTDAPVKVIENGQLIIIRDGVKYNVQGQKL